MNIKWVGLEQGAPMQVIAFGICSHTRHATILELLRYWPRCAGVISWHQTDSVSTKCLYRFIDEHPSLFGRR